MWAITVADFSQQTIPPKEFSELLANFSQNCQIKYIGNAIIFSLQKKKKRLKII